MKTLHVMFTRVARLSLAAIVASSVVAFGMPATRAATISYTVVNTLSGATADGLIQADGVRIGTWSLTGFSMSNANTTAALNVFTALENQPYSYGVPGIGITMTGPSPVSLYGFAYSVSAAIDAGFASSYQVAGVTILGRNPTAGPFIGPVGDPGNWPAGGKGNLTFSGFSGTATLSDPNNNLNAANGFSFSTTTDIGGYLSTGDAANAWTPANLQWSLSSNAGNAMTYSVVYDPADPTQNVVNESTGFAFNVTAVPEPSTVAMVAAAGLAGLIGVGRRRKTH